MRIATVASLTLSVLLLGITSSPASPYQASSLTEVLSLAARYAVTYGESLSTVIAEERYSQSLEWRDRTKLVEGPSRRVLQSEIAFVRLADSNEWLAFRNVIRVDGRPLADSEGRLERLFRDSPDTMLAQARLIAHESARYNIGPITREINVPTTALHFIHPKHQPRCKFRKEGDETIEGVDTWIVRFEEQDHGGLISRSDGRSLPAEGRLWIVPSDGRVLRSELRVKNFVAGGKSLAAVDVRWRYDNAMALWVPDEMRERYDGPSSNDPRFLIEGVATYSNYRRFSTSVRIR